MHEPDADACDWRHHASTLTDDETAEFKKALSVFNKATQDQNPSLFCYVCQQTWFEKSLQRVVPGSSFEENAIRLVGEDILHQKLLNDVLICSQCHTHILADKVPPFAPTNISFPELPEELKGLNQLEEMLISPRLQFMTIHKLKPGNQRSLKGGVVNVPANTDTVQTVLPRPANMMGLVTVTLKRKLEFARSYLRENIDVARRIQRTLERCRSDYCRHPC